MGYERRKEVLHQTIRGWINYFKLADAKSSLIAIDKCFADGYECVYGKVGNTQRHGLPISSNAESSPIGHAYMGIAARGIGQMRRV